MFRVVFPFLLVGIFIFLTAQVDLRTSVQISPDRQESLDFELGENVFEGDTSSVLALLSKGANPNTPALDDLNALEVAADLGQGEMIDVLIDHSAGPHQSTEALLGCVQLNGDRTLGS